MAPPSWAYQVDQFDPPPDEELVCSICRGVFCEPVQSPCHHVFCRECILKWLSSNRYCPICRKRTPKDSVQGVVPLVKNIIMKLTLRCHNVPRGCDEKITLEGCESHLKDCAYELVHCKNRPCKEKLIRRDMLIHETEACSHRYTKCSNCCMKVPTTHQEAHNCVKALKQRLKMRNETLRKKNKKIRELQDEIKALKENAANPEFSDSSLSSVSAGDIVVDLPMSGDSSMESTSYMTDDEEDLLDTLWLTTSDILQGLESNYQRRRNSSEGFATGDDSVEYPRTSSPAPDDSSGIVAVDVAESTFDEDPQVRRPAKRRHPTRFLDTSDDDQDFEQPASSSPKRSWRLFSRDSESPPQSSASMQPDTSAEAVSASPPGAAAAVASGSRSSANASAAASNSKASFKLRPKLNKVSPPEVQEASTTPRSGTGIFERTLSLLEQYNLESDPEWLPATSSHLGEDSDGSLQEILLADGRITSSDESSLSDSSSSSSSAYEDIRKARNLFNSLYTSTGSSSEDPDWQPEGRRGGT